MNRFEQILDWRIPWEASAVLVAVAGIGISVAIPEIRQLVGLAQTDPPPIGFITPTAFDTVPTRRLDTEIALKPNVPREVFPNFFVTYLPPEKTDNVWPLFSRAKLLIDSEDAPDVQDIAAGSIVRHKGQYGDSVLVVISANDTAANIR